MFFACDEMVSLIAEKNTILTHMTQAMKHGGYWPTVLVGISTQLLWRLTSAMVPDKYCT